MISSSSSVRIAGRSEGATELARALCLRCAKRLGAEPGIRCMRTDGLRCTECARKKKRCEMVSIPALNRRCDYRADVYIGAQCRESVPTLEKPLTRRSLTATPKNASKDLKGETAQAVVESQEDLTGASSSKPLPAAGVKTRLPISWRPRPHV